MFFYLFPSLHICVCVCDDFSKEWKSLYLVSVLWYLNWLERDLNDKKIYFVSTINCEHSEFLKYGPQTTCGAFWLGWWIIESSTGLQSVLLYWTLKTF